jgi:predicted alpha-1,2-mannosidase
VQERVRLLLLMKVPLLIMLTASMLLFLLIKPLLFASPTMTIGNVHASDLQTLFALNRAVAVDPFTGTGEQKLLPAAYSGGETFPGADVPFGMVQWSPDTVEHAYSGYDYNDNRIRGFSLTHLSGAGCSTYGDIPFMPYPDMITDSPASDPARYIASFSHASETAYAGYYMVRLSNGVTTELSVTQRSGAGRFTYPTGAPESMLLNLAGSLNKVTDAHATIGRDTISGWISSGNFCYLKQNAYRIYFWAQFSQPFTSTGTWQAAMVASGQTSVSGPGTGVFVNFAAVPQGMISVRVGISFVSMDNARVNVEQENPSGDFDAIHRQAMLTWDSWLSKIQVGGGTPEQVATFYTALYHTLLFPSVFSDVNGEYIGFDERVHRVAAPHVQYANFSSWDIYRSEIQLLTLLAPEETSDMARSLLNDYQQDGILPRWPLANHETYAQVGDSADAIIADIYAFGGTDFDAHAALAAMIKQAMHSGRGRPGLKYLKKLGYEPLDGAYGCCNTYGSASTTLEYNADDFAISALAASLGDDAHAREFVGRAQDWHNLFNSATDSLEPRYQNGNFPSAYSLVSQKGWVEGNSAQYTWMVPFNLRGLFSAMGGNASVIQRLDTFFTQLDAGLDEPYAFLGNEPTLEVPWEYDYAGAPYKTQQVVRQIVTTLYLSAPSGLPGNDDLGELSSWYIFAAMGIYPETPGAANLVLASPLFPSITLRRPGGQLVQINAPGASASTYYVQSLKVNGQLSARPWLPPSFIANGGTLDYTLGSTPNIVWGAEASNAPPSYE